MLRPHNELSDWYAYLVMLCQSLLFVGPYGGVHRPKAGKRLQHDTRVLQRITVFNPDVLYPKKMPPLSVLPDELLAHMQKVFERDEREIFPLRLLDSLRWTTCSGCGALHARSVCPSCAAPGAVKEKVVIRGQVTATRVFRTDGRILHVVNHGGELRYLYHQSGSFRREGGREVIPGQLQPDLRYRIQGDTTLLGVGNRLLVFAPDAEPQRLSIDACHGLPVFDANSQHRYWIDGSQLVRDDALGSSYIGDVLQGQTLFWTGRRFGFGYYQAGRLRRYFVFDGERRGLNDQVSIGAIPGQIVDATCVFSDDLAWFMVQTQTGGQLINRCYVIDRRGQVIAQTEAQAGDDSWLAAGIRGHLATSGRALFAATDEGLVRIVADNGTVMVERSFPDTEPFVSAGTQLVPAQQGIYAVSGQEIVLLQIR